MAPGPPPTDPRREQLRRQAIARRQGVRDRLAATRSIVIGAVVAVTCVLAGYLDASAHTRSTSNATTGVVNGGGSNSYSSSNSSAQEQFGGGSAPSASSGTGAVVSGGS